MGSRWTMLFLVLAVSCADLTPAQDRTDITRCGAEQITATNDENVALGSVYIQMTLRNTSTAACLLSGGPRVVALDVKGKELPATVHWPVELGEVGKGQESLDLAVGDRAIFLVQTLDRTGLGPEHSCADGIQVYLPDGGQIGNLPHVESCREINVSGYKLQKSAL